MLGEGYTNPSPLPRRNVKYENEITHILVNIEAASFAAWSDPVTSLTPK